MHSYEASALVNLEECALPNGVSSIIANFGMLTGDIDVIDSNDPEEEKLADWINDQLRTPSSRVVLLDNSTT